jgi:exosortase/archaeosortase family protein
MPPRAALLLFGAACWDGWRLLARRIEGGLSALLVLAVLGGVAIGFGRSDPATRIAPAAIVALLLAYAAASVTGPALLQIGVAVAGLTLLAQRAGLARLPRMPLVGLALLALPVLPTLDFLLAYPLRRVSAAIAAALLRLNGMAVGVDGIALKWHGQLLLFDAPCSGIRMLWTAWLLASLIALAGRFGVMRYGGALIGATLLAIAGNGLRGASLFYLENGLVAPVGGVMAHELVGTAAFLLVGLAIVAVLAFRRPLPAGAR